MTRHLYYEDSYLTDFSAMMLEQFVLAGNPAVVLDRTAFYPESGGQPCDLGTLGGAKVTGVKEDDDGRIVHMLDEALPAGEVRGIVDWERRFDHMQQHTGQHILSQAFLHTARAATLSFHLGQEASTIDVDLAQPDASILHAAGELAARIVFEDRPVHILNVMRADLGALGVRKESQREGEIRVIDIEGFDRSPCGGTHVRRCGEIGSIFILGSERYKGGTRVEFLCGGRVLKAFRKAHDTLRDLGRLMSAHPHEIPKLVEKIMQERTALLREKKHLEEQILELEAFELLQQAPGEDGVRVIRRTYKDRDLESVKVLARKAAASPGTIAILFALQDSSQIVVARHADLPGDCGAVVKQLTGKLGGRGGGKPDMAQAGGIPLAAVEEWSQGVADYFRAGRR